MEVKNWSFTKVNLNKELITVTSFYILTSYCWYYHIIQKGKSYSTEDLLEADLMEVAA